MTAPRRAILFLALCLTAAGCAGPFARSADAHDVYEAAFRHCLRNFPADVTAYLRVDDGDVPAEVLDRLRRDWPNLRPASAEPPGGGVRVYAEGLKWLDRDTAELRAGYWFPTKFAGEAWFGDHRLARKAGRWVVEAVTNETMT
jgi:hypothetical protein